jgi:hypothetical protein
LPRVDPFLATGIYRQTRDVAIRVGRGRAEYAKPVYGANCVRLTAADVQKWDQILSIGGFVGKTSHALEMCFGSDGDRYTEECFRLSPKEERLYDIRNAINHGDIDAENPNELLRVEARIEASLDDHLSYVRPVVVGRRGGLYLLNGGRLNRFDCLRRRWVGSFGVEEEGRLFAVRVTITISARS